MWSLSDLVWAVYAQGWSLFTTEIIMSECVLAKLDQRHFESMDSHGMLDSLLEYGD